MTKTAYTTLAILAGCCFTLSCGKYDFAGFVMSTSDDTDRRFATSMEYNAKHGNYSVSAEKNDYELFAFADCHVKNETSPNLDAFVATYISHSSTAPLALFLGDIVDGKDGWDIFANSVKPLSLHGHLFMTAGNHDLYFGQWPEYVKRFGSSTYWFEIVCPSAKDLYICLDSASGTLGRDQRAWLEDLLREKSAQYRNVIVFTHTHFFKKDSKQGHTSNFAMEETYDLLDLFSKYGVDLVLTAHKHFHEEQAFKGVRYFTVDCLSDEEPQAGYLVCQVGTEIEAEFVRAGI